jgi:hypothetical protein
MNQFREHSTSIIGHVFDGDGDPVTASISVASRTAHDERCLVVRGIGWDPEGRVPRGDDLQFCLPLEGVRTSLFLAEPNVFTVFGIYANVSRVYPDIPDERQPKRWSHIVEASTPTGAVRVARHRAESDDNNMPTGETAIVVGCFAGTVTLAGGSA